MTSISTLRARSFFRFFDFFHWGGSGGRAPQRAAPSARPRLCIEALEDRTTPALVLTPTGTSVTLDETAGLQNNDTDTSLPAAFSSRLTDLGANPATAINAAVSNGNVISITSSGAVNNLALTDAAGAALDGDASGLSTNAGDAIFLYTDTLNDNILLGKTIGGDIAFAVFVEETGSPVSGGKLWSVLYKPLEHPDANNPDDSIDLGTNVKVAASERIDFAFGGTPSGDHLFTMVKSGTDGLIATPETEVVKLHISQGGGPTTLGLFNQMIDPNETMVLTFLHFPGDCLV